MLEKSAKLASLERTAEKSAKINFTSEIISTVQYLVKGLTNEKRGGCQWFHSIGLALSCTRGNFQTN
jgi:hypothetical protein